MKYLFFLSSVLFSSAPALAQAGSAAFGVVEIHRTIEEDGISRMRPAGVLERPIAEVQVGPEERGAVAVAGRVGAELSGQAQLQAPGA